MKITSLYCHHLRSPSFAFQLEKETPLHGLQTLRRPSYGQNVPGAETSPMKSFGSTKLSAAVSSSLLYFAKDLTSLLFADFIARRCTKLHQTVSTWAARL